MHWYPVDIFPGSQAKANLDPSTSKVKGQEINCDSGNQVGLIHCSKWILVTPYKSQLPSVSTFSPRISMKVELIEMLSCVLKMKIILDLPSIVENSISLCISIWIGKWWGQSSKNSILHQLFTNRIDIITVLQLFFSVYPILQPTP